MKITKLETFIVPPRWCFLKIETDEGIVGWGEPVVEGRAHTVAAAVEELSDYLIGKDPLLIEDHWQVMYRAGFYRGGPIGMSAIAGVDQALWDIKGKHHGVPVHALLGGQVRDKIKVYSWIGGDRPSDVANNARAVVERGFKAVKMNGSEELQIIDTFDKVQGVINNVAAVREGVGPNIGIGVGFPRAAKKADGEGARQRARSVQTALHRGAGAVGERRGAARHRQSDQHADRPRRAALLALGLQAHPRGRLRRHHPAGRVACGWHHRVSQDCVNGRS